MERTIQPVNKEINTLQHQYNKSEMTNSKKFKGNMSKYNVQKTKQKYNEQCNTKLRENIHK